MDGTLQIIAGLLVAALGGGGIASLIKARADKQAGVKAQALAETSASEDWWQGRLEAQTKALIDPLRTEVAELRVQVASLRREVEESRTKYWAAIQHGRNLTFWVKRNAQHVDVSLPIPPAVIAEDIGDLG